MSYRETFRRLLNTNPFTQSRDHASAGFHFAETSTPRLTHRSMKISERRDAEVIERKAGLDPAPFFVTPPKPAETAKKWSSERTIEIEESFE